MEEKQEIEVASAGKLKYGPRNQLQNLTSIKIYVLNLTDGGIAGALKKELNQKKLLTNFTCNMKMITMKQKNKCINNIYRCENSLALIGDKDSLDFKRLRY